MSAYVYLLAHLSAPRFKIGKAVDVAARVRQLGVNRFDYSQSRALRVAEDADAVNLERLLHRAFAKSRLAAADVVGFPGESTCGDSEWFSADCKSRLDQFLETNQDLLGFELVPEPDFKAMLRPPVKSAEVKEPPVRTAKVKPARAPARSDAEQQAMMDQVIAEFLAKLSAFTSLAKNLQFEPPPERQGYGTLSGVLPRDSGLDARKAFAEFMDCGVQGQWWMFRFVSGVTFVENPQHVSFEVSIIWPNGHDVSPTFTYAASRIAAYPLGVPGWVCTTPDQMPSSLDEVSVISGALQ